MGLVELHVDRFAGLESIKMNIIVLILLLAQGHDIGMLLYYVVFTMKVSKRFHLVSIVFTFTASLCVANTQTSFLENKFVPNINNA